MEGYTLRVEPRFTCPIFQAPSYALIIEWLTLIEPDPLVQIERYEYRITRLDSIHPPARHQILVNGLLRR